MPEDRGGGGGGEGANECVKISLCFSFHYPARLYCIPNIIIKWLLYFKANGRRFVCHYIYSNITKHPSSLSLSTNFSNKKKAEQILYEYE
jgi:hypothetical protein